MEEVLHYAPLLASAVAIIAFLSGLWQFRTTQRLSREAKAVDLFLKFNELNEKLPIDLDAITPATFWQHNAQLAITEAVFRLTDGDDSWAETVQWMLQTQQRFLTQSPINCGSFSSKFVDQIKIAVPQVQCADRQSRHLGAPKDGSAGA